MKFYFLMSISLVMMTCKGVSNLEEKPDCPEGYECYAEVLVDKTINLLEDTIGKTYIRLENDKNFNVIKYTYYYEGDPQISDDTYQENIYFQISKTKPNLELTDEELSEVKLIIQKSCFCRDAGYELIKDGNLKINRQNNTYNIQLSLQSKKQMKISGFETSIQF